MKQIFLLSLMIILCVVSSCSDDDDDMMTTPDPELTIDLPEFISYNTGMNPLLPEGIEFDIDRESFIVSSATGVGISLIDVNGAVSSLVAAPTFGGDGVFGLQIDQSNDRLLAVSSNLQNPAIAKLYIFQLSDGDLIHNIDLSSLSPGLNFVNDVAVDTDGNAYVTNSDQGIIFKVDMAGTASIFFQDNSFTPADATMETGFNGIEYHDDGYLIISHYETNKIYKLDISNPSSLSEVVLPEGFVRGGDGIYLDNDELVVVNNAAVPFVSKFTSSNGWDSGSLVDDTYATGDIFPTAVVKVGDDYMINNSYFNYPAYANTPVNFLLSKANFDVAKRYSGSSAEIPRVNTPVMPMGYGNSYPDHFYADCDTPIGSGIPDLQGDWTEQDVTIDGVEISASASGHSERIEQCGNRILVVAAGVLHEVFIDDDTMINGVNDINPQGQPIHASGMFEGNMLVLTPVFPPQTGIMLPAVTRELIEDDMGNDVLRFFNAQIGSVKYLRR